MATSRLIPDQVVINKVCLLSSLPPSRPNRHYGKKKKKKSDDRCSPSLPPSHSPFLYQSLPPLVSPLAMPCSVQVPQLTFPLSPSQADDDDFSLAFARIENHFFINRGFFPYDDWILK